jgi:hypothetical protein
MYYTPETVLLERSNYCGKIAGHVACMQEIRNAYILVGITGGERPLRRSKHRGKNNIKMYPKQTGCERLE